MSLPEFSPKIFGSPVLYFDLQGVINTSVDTRDLEIMYACMFKISKPCEKHVYFSIFSRRFYDNNLTSLYISRMKLFVVDQGTN